MDHYIDIKILLDPDFTTQQLMNALFNKLHRSLVVYQSNCIAVSFPAMGKDKKAPMGNIFRLHGLQENLANLMEANWLKGMNDHIAKTDITAVPINHDFIQLRRVQCKSNVMRLRERRMKRHNETLAQATQAIPDSVEQTLTLPHMAVKSASTKQSFRLFIKQQAVESRSLVDNCNCYGIAKSGVLPSFESSFKDKKD